MQNDEKMHETEIPGMDLLGPGQLKDTPCVLWPKLLAPGPVEARDEET